MKATHTPGPWDIGYAQADDIVIVGPDKELEICTVWSDPNVCDAKLIAAAPEMLDALRQMLACCYDIERNDETIAAVKAAMKAVLNATGETK